MPVHVENGDLAKIAGNLGRQGKPAPGWVTSDPALAKAYTDAGGTLPASTPAPASTPPKPDKQPHKTPAKPPAQATPKPSPGSGNDDKPPGWFSRSVSPSAAAQRVAGGTAGKVSTAGDSGGLLLAVIVFPVLQSILRYGADGPRVWFRAKWLNKTTKDSAVASSSSTPQNAAGSNPKGQLTPRTVKVGAGGPERVR